MSNSYSDKDQPPAVSASNPGGSGSEKERGAMTRADRLMKLQSHAVPRSSEQRAKGQPRSFKEITAKAVFSKPIVLSEVLDIRGKRYFQSI